MKIKIYQNKESLKKIKEYDEYNLLSTIVFFMSSHFKKIFNEIILNKIEFYIEFLDDKSYESNSRACFFVWENKLQILLNVDNILRVKTFKDDKTGLKSLLFNFLHELKHSIICINDSINENNTFEECYDKNNESITELIDKIKKEHPELTNDEMLISRLIPEELDCDYFAFENLQTILNIYNYNEILI